MNNEINNGGPAFPISLHGWGDNGAGGMTLRDYFASKAMQPLKTSAKKYREAEAEGMARDAYMIADAMLRARGQS